MAFSNEIKKQSSVKQCLVKMTVGLKLNTGELYNATTPPLYSRTISSSEEITRVTFQGIDGTYVEGTPNADGEWTRDSEKVVWYLGSVNPATTVVAFIAKYYCDTVFYEYEGKTYEPRLGSIPKISRSIDSINAGLITVNSTTVELINVDGLFSRYSTYPYTFGNKMVEIFFRINKSVKKVFEGKVVTFSTDENLALFQIKDVLANFDRTALFGDTLEECYHFISDNAALYENADGIPKQLILAREWSDVSLGEIVDSISGKRVSRAITKNPSRFLSNTDFDSANDPDTTNNRTWGGIRCLGNVDYLNNTYTVDHTKASVAHSSGVTTIDFLPTDAPLLQMFAELQAGLFVVVTQGASVYRGRILAKAASIFRSIILTDMTGLNASSDFTIERLGISIIVSDGETDTLIGKGGYTIQSSETSGGNLAYEIVFANNFEATYALSPLSPATHEVYYSFYGYYPTEIIRASNIIEKGVELAGLNAGTITNSGNVLASFTVPPVDDSTYQPYRDILQKLLRELNLGLTFNDDFELDTFRLTPDSLAADDRTESNIVNIKLYQDYQDIFGTVLVKRPLIDTVVVNNNYDAKHLYEVDQVAEVENLTNIGTANYLQDADTIYEIETPIDLDKNLGHMIIIKHKNVLDDSEEKKIRILSIENNDFSTGLRG